MESAVQVCEQRRMLNIVYQTLFGRPLVKRFALCYPSVVCLCCAVLSCLSVTLMYCGQTVEPIKMKMGKQVGLCPVHIVLGGDRALPPPKGHSLSEFSAHTCCGQMAARIKMPLGMELGLDPGDFVLDRDPAQPPQKGAEPPDFRSMFIVAKRLD